MLSLLRMLFIAERGSPEDCERRRINAPIAFLAIRERALSVSPMKPEQGRRMHDQVQSVFFSKLPGKLHMLIYEQSLGGKVLHVIKETKRLRYFGCKVNGWRGQTKVFEVEVPWM